MRFRQISLIFPFVLLSVALSAQDAAAPQAEPAAPTAMPGPMTTSPYSVQPQNVPQLPNNQGTQTLNGKQNGTQVKTEQSDLDKQNEREAKNVTANPNAPEPLSDFQVFVEQTVGHQLPLFGENWFRSPSSFAPVENTPVPADYAIGPGDVIEFRMWGPVDYSAELPVERDGTVFLPRVGNVVVAGTRYSDLNARLQNSLARMFKNFQLSATISRLRTVQIYVTGNAARPGVFTVSSLSTLVNAIFASGGPSNMGSMRSIELRRGGKLISTFDMYDLVARGDISKDTHLLPGDIIFYPEKGREVAVPSQVKVPAIYELKNESTVKDVLKLAGGFTTTAFTHELTLESISNSTDRKVEHLTLDDAGNNHPVKDGDLLILAPISPRYENAVTLRGSVARAGRYPYFEGMRVKDLIPNWQSLITPEYWLRVNHSSTRVSEAGIRGDVRSEMVDVNWDYAMIERIDPGKVSTQLLTFDLGKVVLENDQQNNIELKPGDIVTIFAQNDFGVPEKKRTKFVSLEGEFKHAGVYRLEGDESLTSLIERSGGLTDDAYVEGIELTREEARARQQKALNEYVKRLEADLEQSTADQQLNAANATTGSVSAVQTSVRYQRELIAQLKSSEPTGRISLRVRKKDGNVELPPIALQDGDRVIVPARPVTVSVSGSVYNAGDFMYSPKTGAHEYIRMAGGTTRNADTSKVFVVSASGEARGAGRWSHMGSVMPGDTIIVPQHPNPGQAMRDLKDFSQILSSFGLAAAAIKVLIQ